MRKDPEMNENFLSLKHMSLTQEQIAEALTAMAWRTDEELFLLTEAELAGQWYWCWDSDMSIEWNTYKFFDMLELHQGRCKRWEEHHNGSCCVVERVRDKYVMPRVRDFLAAMTRHVASS